MSQILWSKLKEALISVLPVTLIVVILHFTPLISLTNKEIIVFVISSITLIIGIGLFNMGADLAMTPMGEQVGVGITKMKNEKLLLIICFILGILVTVAEPDLSVLAEQVSAIIDGTTLIIVIGLGVGIFLVLSIIKILFNTKLSNLLTFFYFLLFALVSLIAINEKGYFLPLAFDSGGVTTGPITVPFIMALGVGIAATIGGRNAKENSFGLIALCSIGPIIAVACIGIISKNEVQYAIPSYAISSQLFKSILTTLWSVSKEVLLALGLIVIFFFIINAIILKLPKKRIKQIIVGIIITFVGLVIFLTSVNIGFMPIGFKLGTELAQAGETALIIAGFILGFVVVLAEPAIHVLNKQVEHLTNGMISKKSMLIALCVGVGISIGLSMLRIALDFSILYYLIPGYFISLGLSFFVPSIYTAIAFDSGGVASGPLTSSFILPFSIGACMILQGEQSILSDAFGIVAIVAMTPLISIQLLGFKSVATKKAKEKIAMIRIKAKDDKQIINFN